MKYNRYTPHFIGLAHINDYTVGHVDYIPIICFCMLLVLLHDVCTICTIARYKIGTMILLIAQDFVFRHR